LQPVAIFHSRIWKPHPAHDETIERVWHQHVPRGGKMSDLSHMRETSDNYCREIFRAENHRIILCKDYIQWIIQRRKVSKSTRVGQRWKALAYTCTKKALNRRWAHLTGDLCPDILGRLPDHANQMRQNIILNKTDT
jgi:hypothetical protein